MPLLRHDEVPIIGETYLVPCVRVFTSTRLWLPVHPQLHADEALHLPDLHYHCDWRFWTDTLLRRIRGCGWGVKVQSYPIDADFVIEGPQLRRKRCVREAPLFPSPRLLQDRLHRAFGHLRLPPGCLTCPHRGMTLAGAPRQIVNGREVIVCPGHGLAFDVATGAVVRRKDDPRYL